MRALLLLASASFLAGCSGSPAVVDGPMLAPGADETAAADRTGRVEEPAYACKTPPAFAAGPGGTFLFEVDAGNVCPRGFDLDGIDGKLLVSGRMTLEWTQPAPTMLEGYLELKDDGQVVASGSSATSPLVVEFPLEPTPSMSGRIIYGGTGAAVATEFIVTLELFTTEAPAATGNGTSAR